MKVICENYKECEYSNICNHSKEHDIIRNYSLVGMNYIFDSENCHLDKNYYNCHCTNKYLRIKKLKNLKIISK